MYGFSWKETAKNLSVMNMINFNKKWFNGMTYRELIEKSMKHPRISVGQTGGGREIHYAYMGKLRYDYMNENFGESYIGPPYNLLEYRYPHVFDGDKVNDVISSLIDDREDRETIEEIDEHFQIFEEILTREYSIIMLALAMYDSSFPPISGPLINEEDYFNLNDKNQYSTQFTNLQKLIGVEYYVMQVSILTNSDIDNLSNFNRWGLYPI